MYAPFFIFPIHVISFRVISLKWLCEQKESIPHLVLRLRGGSAMQIFVKILMRKTITLDVESSDTLEAVKQKIVAHEKRFYFHQYLMHDQKPLAESRTLADYDIEKASTLHLVYTPPCGFGGGSITVYVCDRNTGIHHATLKLSAWAKILDVKKSIATHAAQLVVPRKLPQEEQLLYVGDLLADNNASLRQWMSIEQRNIHVIHPHSPSSISSNVLYLEHKVEGLPASKLPVGICSEQLPCQTPPTPHRRKTLHVRF